MRIKSLLVTIFIASISLPQIAQSETNNQMALEKSSVLKTISNMVENFQSRNIDGVMKTYETKPLIVFEPGSEFTSPDQIKKAFSEFASANPKFTFHGHDVLVAGDVALHISPWVMKASTPDGEISQEGLSVAVLRKQKDGKWLMVIDNPFGDHLLKARPE